VPANKLSNHEHLKAPNSAAVTVVGGTVPKQHDGWMWDLTVPGNNDHDFYVQAATTDVLVHNTNEPRLCDLTLGPGPYAKEGVALEEFGNIDAPGVQELTNDAGNLHGCHTCGTMNPGTRLGNWVRDELPPKRLVSPGTPQTVWPQCVGCMRQQGGFVNAINSTS